MRRDEKKRRSLYEYEQSFDLFEEFERGEDAAPVRPRSDSLGYRTIFFAGFFITMVVCGFGFFGLIKQEESRTPFVITELRAINESGNPIAGVEVLLDGKVSGLTDSFGEWRRYLRLKSGSQLRITMRKELGGTTFSASKSVRVPDSLGESSEELEIKLTLELLPPSHHKVDGKTQKLTTYPTSLDKLEVKSSDPVPSEPLPPESDVSASSQDFRDTAAMNSIDIKMLPFRQNSKSLTERRQARILSDSILPKIRELAHEDGLKNSRDADFKVEVSYIPLKEEVGFVGVELSYSHRGTPTTRRFLTKFSQTIIETTENILRVIRKHINRPYRIFKKDGTWLVALDKLPRFWALQNGQFLMNSDRKAFGVRATLNGAEIDHNKIQPCQSGEDSCLLYSLSKLESPPTRGWQKQVLRFDRPLPEGSSVYVEGFEALPLEGRYVYWSQAAKPQFLTILKESQIIYHKVVEAISGQDLRVDLPPELVSYASLSSSAPPQSSSSR